MEYNLGEFEFKMFEKIDFDTLKKLKWLSMVESNLTLLLNIGAGENHPTENRRRRTIFIL